MRKFFKQPLILLGLLLLASWFYWFQYRPAKIKHDCSWVTYKVESLYCKYVRERGKSILMDFFNEEINKCKDKEDSYLVREASYKTREATQKEYEFCIHDKGL